MMVCTALRGKPWELAMRGSQREKRWGPSVGTAYTSVSLGQKSNWGDGGRYCGLVLRLTCGNLSCSLRGGR